MSIRLIVEVEQARKLQNTQTFGTQDPYVKLTLGRTMQKTRVHEDGGKHAIWNQKIIFKYIGENKILVQCMNSNTMSDNLIGHVEIPLGNLTFGNPVDQWFQIYNKKRKLSGEIKMKLYKQDPQQQQRQNMQGQIGKNILNNQLGGGAMGMQNAAVMQQQMMMQQQQQQMEAQKQAMLQQQQQQAQLQAQLQQQAAQKQALLQQQQQQAQLQAQLQQQQQQQMMQQQAGMMSNGMQPMYGGGGANMYGGGMGMQQPMQQAVQQQRLAVTVPYGVMGGQQIIINVPGKGQMMVTVPMGMQAGQSFQVAV